VHQCGALLCHRCTSEAQEDQQRLVKLLFNGYKFLLASVFFPFSIANQLANEPTNQKLLASQPASQPINRSVNWLVDQSIHRLPGSQIIKESDTHSGKSGNIQSVIQLYRKRQTRGRTDTCRKPGET